MGKGTDRGAVSALGMALACGAAGLVVGLWVARQAVASDYALFPLYATLAAALAGGGLWWLLVARRSRYRLPRGAVVGGLAGIVAHPLCWYLAVLGQNACYWLWGGCRSSLNEPPVDPLNGLWAAVLLALGSLFFFGWLTVPLGALVGGLWAAWARPTTRPRS